MFRDAHRATALLTAAVRGAELDVERMQARAEEGGTTLTEVADRLVRDEDMPFSKAHAAAARMRTSPVSARQFVEERRTPGGPALEQTGRALAASRELFDRDRAWLEAARTKVENADIIRRERAGAI
jgi:argininosuccinate lyase